MADGSSFAFHEGREERSGEAAVINGGGRLKVMISRIYGDRLTSMAAAPAFRGSKAQVGLAKIIATIVAGDRAASGLESGKLLDPHTGMGPAVEIGKASPAVAQCDEIDDDDVAVDEKISEIIEFNPVDLKGEERIDEILGYKRENDEGYLDLLIEAARQVSQSETGDLNCDADHAAVDLESRPASRPSKRRSSSVAAPPPDDEEELCYMSRLGFYNGDSGPVVRSKRGRSQALPSRYRDSILDPWRKLPAVCGRSAARP